MTAPLNLGTLRVPSAKIAVNRNVVKHYGDKVYLKNKTHFEIELFNPKSKKILAKIFINGESISTSGIVVRPGERIFIERWIDTPRKFLFETYEVENSPEAKAAISNNGKVRVEFHDETIVVPQPITWITTYPYTPIVGGTYDVNQVYYSNSSSSIGSSANQEFLSSVLNTSSNANLETGRAEKGESSNQNFINDNSSYEWWSSSSVDLQILPESQKPVEVSKVRNYCTDCGTRVKSSSWKYCPTCGQQL